MRYKELTESYLRNTEIDEDHARELIRTHCSEIIDKPALYRGNNYNWNYYFGKIRTDRTPLDSSQNCAKIFDNLMEYNNWPFRKSNTLSTTVDPDQGRAYGSFIHRIYPFNGSQYLISTLYDLGAVCSKLTGLLTTNLQKESYLAARKHLMDEPNRYLPEINSKFLEIANMHTDIDDLTQYDVHNNIGEILVYGQNYIAVPKGWKL